MKIFNSLSGKIEEFEPIVSGKIKMYVCGPTVYDKGHLGHGRSMVVFDLIRRYFLYKGFEVEFVSNFTDIDDKMIDRAKEEGVSVAELAEKIIPIYEKDFAGLNILEPSVRPLATDFVETMLMMIKKMLKEDVAYLIEDDGIYFDIAKFSEYGKLSKQRLDELQHGARIDIKDSKRGKADFVLWKFKKEGEPSWKDVDEIVPEGRPGWHIECSAMTFELLGETFDIHGGGQDLVFPHHECEIAQSEIFTGKKMANYWMHNGFVNIDGEKMSKSLNNFTTLEDTFKSFDPLIVRYLFLTTHYRAPIDFNETSLEQARSGLKRIQDFYWRVIKEGVEEESLEGQNEELDAFLKEYGIEAFDRFMGDDFNVSGALSVVFEVIRFVNLFLDRNLRLTSGQKTSILEFLSKFNDVFAVLVFEEKEFSDEIKTLIESRKEARLIKDFVTSDFLRDQLTKLGVEVKDTNDGSFYS